MTKSVVQEGFASFANQPPRVRRKWVIVDRSVRINERIRAREVRVIDEDGKQLGIMPPFEALKAARSRGLDLVEVAPTASPPVCRIINYGKYLYQLSKRQHEARKHQKSVGLKEVKFRPRTSEHDYGVKRDRVMSFLQEGNKVKATVMFRGRELAHRDIGMQMMERLIAEVGEVGQAETRPRQDGPNLTAILAPKKAMGRVGIKPSPPAPSPGGQPAARPAPARAALRPDAGAASPVARPQGGGSSGE